MIKGEIIQAGAEYNEEQAREEYYQYSLDQIAGIPGHAYGVMDELHDLGMLLRTMGETIKKEEAEFTAIEKEEHEPEISSFISDKVLAVWHKKMYRQYTYKSMMMLIQLTFENAMLKLYHTLVEEKRIEDSLQPRHRTVLDIIKLLSGFDAQLPSLAVQVRGFNFVRNKVAHADGYFEDPSTDIDAFKKISKDRDDIVVTKLATTKGRFTHRMKIIRSTVLTDYLGVIKKVFEALIKGAKELDYKEAGKG